MRQAVKRQPAPYVPQPWAIKMIRDLARIALDPSKMEQCGDLSILIEEGKISSLEAARRFKELR